VENGAASLTRWLLDRLYRASKMVMEIAIADGAEAWGSASRLRISKRSSVPPCGAELLSDKKDQGTSAVGSAVFDSDEVARPAELDVPEQERSCRAVIE
jgi:hypothetical protein